MDHYLAQGPSWLYAESRGSDLGGGGTDAVVQQIWRKGTSISLALPDWGWAGAQWNGDASASPRRILALAGWDTISLIYCSGQLGLQGS